MACLNITLFALTNRQECKRYEIGREHGLTMAARLVALVPRGDCICQWHSSHGGRLTRNDDGDDDDDDEHSQADPHLHVLPPGLVSALHATETWDLPHGLPHAIRPSAEPLGGPLQVVRLVLQRIEAFAALRDLVDVVAHDADRAVDLLLAVSTDVAGLGMRGWLQRANHAKCFSWPVP
jgi:hypothetical protein